MMKFQVKCEAVLNAYSGKEGCMCGCLGSYVYPSDKVEAASKSRGYPVRPEEVNDRTVKARVNRLNKMVASGDYDELDANEQYVYASKGGRCVAVYFK